MHCLPVLLSPIEILLSLSSANGPLEGALQAYEYTRSIKVGFTHSFRIYCTAYLLRVRFFASTSLKVSHIARQYFNETQGALAVERLSTERCSHLTNLGSSPYYLALASCGALVRYIEHTNNTLFVPGSLRITFKPNEGTLFLDIATMEGLELVQNGRAPVGPMKGISQLEAMRKTKTRAGSRLLRRSLLEPPAELSTITLRQDSVAELSSKEEMYFNIVAVLSKFPDLERALSGLLARENTRARKLNIGKKSGSEASRPGTVSTRGSSAFGSRSGTATRTATGTPSSRALSRPVDFSAIDDARIPSITTVRNVIGIKSALDTLDEVLRVLDGVRSSLLRGISRSMRMAELSKLQEAIDEVIVPEAAPSKDVEHMRLQGAFAVRAGRDEELDTARKTLSENIEEMNMLTASLQSRYGLKKLALSMTAKRGYHLTFPTKLIKLHNLPREFIQVQKAGRLLRFSTDALNSLNNRYIGSLEEIWKHTDMELKGLLQVIFAKDTLIALYRLCDGVALLDLLASFVTYSSISPVPHIRPRMTVSGPIALKKAHHPLLLALNAMGSKPHSLFMDDASALHMITGQNQSGKSTLLKCVGLLAVVSQAGASIPAEFGSFRILHRLLSRFNPSDDISQSQSHFSREMNDVAVILDSIKGNTVNGRQDLISRSRSMGSSGTPRSQPALFSKSYQHVLVLMDELGRSTSTLDGISIAFAILERLVATPGVFVFFTTHFLGLAALEKVHPIVKVFHLGTVLVPQQANSIPEPGSTIVAGDSSVGDEHGTIDAADRITSRTEFTFQLVKGVLQKTCYGIDTARAAGFRTDVIRNALEIRQKLPVRRVATPDEFAAVHLSPEAVAAARRTKGTLAVTARVAMLKSTFNDSESLRRELEKFQSTVRNIRAAQRQSVTGPGGSTPSNES